MEINNIDNIICKLFYYSEDEEYNDEIFHDLWNYDINTRNELLRTIFYLRSHRKNSTGRGLKNIFYKFLIWMSNYELASLIKIIPYIPDCGYWKDLLILMGTGAEVTVIELFGDQLKKDYISYNQIIPGLISMVSKWTPNERSSYDKKYNVFGKIAKYMKISRKTLRCKYLVPLRRYLTVTEQLISDNSWEVINYNLVPKLSLKKYTNSFKKHDYIRFNNFINTTYLGFDKKLELPALVRSYLSSDYIPTSNSFHSHNNNISTEFAIDISGAMSGFQQIVACSLCIDYGNKKWIPFKHWDNNTYIVKDIIGNTSVDKIKNMIFDVSELNIAGFNDLEGAIKISNDFNDNNKQLHLIILSNVLLDDSEFPEISKYQNINHITYWSINLNNINIIEKSKITIIEGYDLKIYSYLCSGNILTRKIYKDINLNFQEKILPNV